MEREVIIYSMPFFINYDFDLLYLVIDNFSFCRWKLVPFKNTLKISVN